MSIDAIALIPLSSIGRAGDPAEGGWIEGEGPEGRRGLWRPLRDGMLLHLEMPYSSPDAALYDALRAWAGKEAPRRIWVFPDTAVPETSQARAVRAATRLAGRWVRASAHAPSLAEKLGLTAEEAAQWQSDLRSADLKRVKAARDLLDRRLQGRDPKEVEALIRDSLRRG